ncbi:MAG: hypothetical protein ACNA8W_23185, partial [Bradymonadaceae bacterium]
MTNDRTLSLEIAEALAEMVSLTCQTMQPLWLDASRKVREALQPIQKELPSDYGPHLRRSLSGKQRSSYKALACWRHSVVWKELIDGNVPEHLIDELSDDEDVQQFREYTATMRAIYFTRCSDEPPFSHSQKKSAAPALQNSEFNEHEIIKKTVKACWASLQIIAAIWCHDAEGGPEADCLYLSLKYK